MSKPVPAEVMDVLREARCEGPRLFLVGQLDRKLYEKVAGVLKDAGGRWNRAAGATVFERDALDAIDPILLTGAVQRTEQDFGQFDTPPEIARTVVDEARIAAGLHVLEPSVGIGNLAREIADRGCGLIHVFGSVTGAGAPTVSPFHAEAIMHYRRHRFDYMGMITVVTDVVHENNQTYRLGYSEMLKDSTKMGVGSPEYVLLLRRPQSDRSKGYADQKVEKDPSAYSLARWQIDAHAFWRSSGNRLLTADELSAMSPRDVPKAFADRSLRKVYDYEEHVAIGEALGERRRLSKKFMTLAPGSWTDEVWHDVVRMQTLNGLQAAAGREKHVCPLQFDIVDRLIDRFSKRDELIFDPFGGLFTVPYCAIGRGRRGAAVELHEQYFHDGVRYLRQREAAATTPTLFDLIAKEEAA